MNFYAKSLIVLRCWDSLALVSCSPAPSDCLRLGCSDLSMKARVSLVTGKLPQLCIVMVHELKLGAMLLRLLVKLACRALVSAVLSLPGDPGLTLAWLANVR